MESRSSTTNVRATSEKTTASSSLGVGSAVPLNLNIAIDQEICSQEERVRAEIAKLSELHQRKTPTPVSDYELRTVIGPVRLSALFGGFTELIVIHNMGKKCAYCTLWADTFNGFYQQLKTRAGVLLVNTDDPDVQWEFANSRGWKFQVASAKGTPMAADLGFAEVSTKPEGGTVLWPGLLILRKGADGQIVRTTHTGFGPGDLFASIYHVLALLPGGAADWAPSIERKVTPQGALEINGVNVVAVYANDLAESERFYVDVLGFVRGRKMDPGILLRHDAAELTMYLEPGRAKRMPDQKSSETVICFNSAAGVLECAERLKKSGVAILSQYGGREQGFAGIHFCDPSGNIIEIAGTP